MLIPYRVTILDRAALSALQPESSETQPEKTLPPLPTNSSADDVDGEKINRAAEQVVKGNLGTPDARQLAAIELVLKKDEDDWLRGEFKQYSSCSESAVANCRRDFLKTIEYRPVTLSPSGQQGLIVQATFFCGSHGCQIYVLKQGNSGYEVVLTEVGTLNSVATAKTTTNGFYDIISETGTVAYPEQTKYVWNGSKFAEGK